VDVPYRTSSFTSPIHTCVTLLVLGVMATDYFSHEGAPVEQGPPLPRRSSRRRRPDFPNMDDQKVLTNERPRSRASYVNACGPAPNFSRVLSSIRVPDTMDSTVHSFIMPAMRQSPCKAHGVKRWNGQSRTLSDWDGLRRVSDDLYPCSINSNI